MTTFTQTGRSVSGILKACRDLMRKDKGLNGDLDRLPQLTWMMFLKFVDDLESENDAKAVLSGEAYTPLIPPPYRWRDWAGRGSRLTGQDLLLFVSSDRLALPDGSIGRGLIPELANLNGGEDFRSQRDVIAQVFRGVSNQMANGYIMRDVLAKIDEMNFKSGDDICTLGLLYEDMLREMRDAAGDSGEFYTPRPLVRLMVKVLNPVLGETVLDPACGTGGFLVEAFEHLNDQVRTTNQRQVLHEATLFGEEAKSLPFMLGQMNLLLHGLEAPNIVLHNSLALRLAEIGDSDRVDVILTNPPFGGEEEDAIRDGFPSDRRTSETALLFLQLISRKLRRRRAGVAGGRAAVVVPNGTLYEQGVAARIRESLMTSFMLDVVLRLPKGVFQPYTDLQTNVLFFSANEPSDGVWFYEHPLPPHRAQLKGKTYSATDGLKFEEFAEFLKWWDNKTPTEHAWRVGVSELAERGYDLALTHPGRQDFEVLAPDEIEHRLANARENIVQSLLSIEKRLHSTRAEGTQAVPLSEILIQRDNRIKIQDDVEYSRPRVQLHFRGVRLRDRLNGANIGTKAQTVMRAGDLIVSRIDARNGAMAIVPPELDGAIATGDFPVFELRAERVDPQFLRFALFQPAMLAEYERASRGSTNRRRLNVSKFLSLTIPLPELVEDQAQLASELLEIQEAVDASRRLLTVASKDLDHAIPAVLKAVFEADQSDTVIPMP